MVASTPGHDQEFRPGAHHRNRRIGRNRPTTPPGNQSQPSTTKTGGAKRNPPQPPTTKTDRPTPHRERQPRKSSPNREFTRSGRTASLHTPPTQGADP
ncbi:hypothetical protein Asi03nite_10850 [Actinoplanes siamensis]|uniref:Uncharacterized protein n=1 Tax=Actinoplanes siamensis TaxID=1223317 RepID=A0A919THI6_9ACTN|nr:hypothetical protein Asi03nite_10850 [Actinoplanes siamensis]